MLSVLFFKEASWRVFFACIFFIFKEMHVLCCFWQDPETYQWYVQASADYFQVTFEEAESMVGRAPPNPMQRALNIDSRGFLPKRLGEFLMEKNWGNIFLGAGSCWVVGGCFFATIFWFISANLFFCSNSGSWNLNLRRIFHCCRYSKHEFDLLKVQKQKASAQTKHDIIVIKKTLLESQQFFQSIKNIYEEIQVWKDDFFEMFPNQKIPGFFKTFLASEFRNAGGVFRNHRGFAGGGVGFAKCIHWKLFEICGNLENFWIYIYIHQWHIGYIPFGCPFLLFFSMYQKHSENANHKNTKIETAIATATTMATSWFSHIFARGVYLMFRYGAMG